MSVTKWEHSEKSRFLTFFCYFNVSECGDLRIITNVNGSYNVFLCIITRLRLSSSCTVNLNVKRVSCFSVNNTIIICYLRKLKNKCPKWSISIDLLGINKTFCEDTMTGIVFSAVRNTLQTHFVSLMKANGLIDKERTSVVLNAHINFSRICCSCEKKNVNSKLFYADTFTPYCFLRPNVLRKLLCDWENERHIGQSGRYQWCKYIKGILGICCYGNGSN